MKLKSTILAAAAVLGAVGMASGAGMFPGFPVIGGASYCSSYVSAGSTYCSSTVPAGPGTMTGNEVFPVDTGIANGVSPQTALIPLSAVPINSKKNFIRGGDFATNLWQRGTTPLSSVTPSTYLMGPDGWFAASASNTMTVSKDTPAATAANSLTSSGLYSWMKVAAPSGTTGSNCVGQILDKNASADLIGKNGVFSFYGYAPAAFAADTNGTISVTVAYYTATDSTTPGTNTATFALSLSGQSSGIAGYQAAVAGLAGPSIGLAGASVASGVATIPLTATPTQYAVYAPIPATNASGTQVIGVGVGFCMTPTTAASGNFFEVEGVQLQAMPGGTANAALPNGVITATGFERIPPNEEARRELAYSYLVPESGSNAVVQSASGTYTTTTLCSVDIPFPVPMREAPSLVISTATGGIGSYTALAATTFGIFPAAAEVNLATPFAAIPTGGANTAGAMVNFTTAAKTQYFACQLASNATAGGGAFLFNAEP